MKNLVVWLTAFGLVLSGLHFLGVHVEVFGWIDNWGDAVGRGIRAALAAGAVLVYALGVDQSEYESA